MFKFVATANPKTVANIIQEARTEEFPLHVLPENVRAWYKAMSFSRNTRPEFVFLSSLSVINTIVGPKTKLNVRAGSTKENIKYPRPAYQESSGLFITLLCEPGSGKTNAFNLAIQDPLSQQTDHILKSLLIQV